MRIALVGLVVILVVAASGSVADATPRVAADTPERAVKATPLDELSPAAEGPYFAWAQNSRRRPGHYDAFVQRGSQRAVRVNAPGTQGWPGAISGTTLVFQQTGKVVPGASDVMFFDLLRNRRAGPPRGVNTRAWEGNPGISGDWLMFDRVSRERRVRVLRNLETGEQRWFLACVRRRLGQRTGQINGQWVVWGDCGPHVRYSIKDERTTETPPSPVLEASWSPPAVAPNGDTYQSSTVNRFSACLHVLGRSATDRTRSGVIVNLDPLVDVSSLYASGTAVYYTRTDARTPGSRCGEANRDIYSIAP